MKFKVNGIHVQYTHCDSIDRPRIHTSEWVYSLRKSGKWLAVNNGRRCDSVDNINLPPVCGGELIAVDNDAREFMRLLANGWEDSREYMSRKKPVEEVIIPYRKQPSSTLARAESIAIVGTIWAMSFLTLFILF